MWVMWFGGMVFGVEFYGCALGRLLCERATWRLSYNDARRVFLVLNIFVFRACASAKENYRNGVCKALLSTGRF